MILSETYEVWDTIAHSYNSNVWYGIGSGMAVTNIENGHRFQKGTASSTYINLFSNDDSANKIIPTTSGFVIEFDIEVNEGIVIYLPKTGSSYYLEKAFSDTGLTHLKYVYQNGRLKIYKNNSSTAWVDWEADFGGNNCSFSIVDWNGNMDLTIQNLKIYVI